ncbi:INO80 complex subunit 2 [Leucoagaricus sp. SymC.cos]|nr:INO80 complex subunit 2 [Leucoagaricus sp. SymC.cos]
MQSKTSSILMSYTQRHGFTVVEPDYSCPDLQPDSDVDMDQNDEIDVENDDDEPEIEDGEGDGEEDDEEEEEEEDKDEIQSEEDDDDEEPIPSPRKQPRLRIRLKLGNGKRIGSSDDSTARPTPEVETTPSRARSRRKVKSDIESEDSLSPESEDEDGSMSGSRPPSHPKPMTARRAVLAGMVDSSHVSLGEGNRSKKKVLNETELALRREETARKRKNLTEKKLEDEKTETINRLLKKQTRPRNKRGTALDDRSPMPSNGRKMKLKTKDDEGEEGEEGDEEEVIDVVEEEVKPIMYRWTSSKKVDGGTTSMVLNFSIPPSVAIPPASEVQVPKPKVPGVCAVEGCGQPRKYRLVKNWMVGACGMPHLKLLEG